MKIMQILSTEARISLIELGKRIKVDPKVVKYRIKKLEKEGIIITYTSAPNFDKLGLQFIQINFSLKNLKTIPAIIDFFDNLARSIATPPMGPIVWTHNKSVLFMHSFILFIFNLVG